MPNPIVDDVPEKMTGRLADGQVPLAAPRPFPDTKRREAHRRRSGVNRRVIIGGVIGILLAIILIVYRQGIFVAPPGEPIPENKPRFVIPASSTLSPTPWATLKATAKGETNAFAFYRTLPPTDSGGSGG